MTLPLFLPLRIETRFRPGPDRPTELWVRVVPDAPWFDGHNATASEDELKELRAWERARDRAQTLTSRLAAATDEPERQRLEAQLAKAVRQRRGAWQRLIDRRGRGRARWLARHGSDREGRADDRGRWNEIIGLPPELHVWLLPELAGVEHTESRPRLTLRPRLEDIDLKPPGAPLDTAEGERWWNSFDAAVRVGLAGVIPLDDDDLARLPFDALVVVGLGDARAGDLFAAHRDRGNLAVLQAGQSTNTVSGDETPVKDGDDREEPGAPPAVPAAVRALSRLLFGEADQLDEAPLPASPGEMDVQRAVVQALWPVLWGHSLGNLWLTGDVVPRIAPWAMAALRPEGPLPALRIGSQPYGVLPILALDRFTTDPALGEPGEVGKYVVPRLIQARRTWLEAANRSRTVVGASAAELLDLAGRTPISGEVRWRKMFPYDLLPADFRDSRPPEEHAADWHSSSEELNTFGLLPWRRMASIHGVRASDLARVVPAGQSPGAVATAIGNLLAPLTTGWRPSELANGADVAGVMGTDASVLLRLARAALQLALAEEGRRALGEEGPTVDAVLQLKDSPFLRWIAAAPSPESGSTLALVIEGLQSLGSLVADHPDAVDRCLRGALDCASHRLDAWLNAPAVRRLVTLLERDDEPEAARLGAYGWLDDLRPGGGGPTPGGAIMAPSADQAKAAAILRDRQLREGGGSRWEMNVTSRRARAASKLADAVRAGLHPAIALGLEVEGIVDDPIRVQDLRARYPARRNDGGRRVCDGLAILERIEIEGNLWSDLDGVSVTSRLRAELGTIVDTYADLLVAQSVHHVVQGRGAIAGAALDAAAGFSTPPDLEVLSSPTQARQLRSVVVAALPFQPVYPPEPGTPAQLADPHVAALLDARYPSARFEWQVRATARQGTATETVSLSDLGLRPSDAVCMSVAGLEEVVRADAAVALARRLAAPAPTLRMELVSAAGSDARRSMGRFVRGLGDRPLTPADLSAGGADYDPDPDVMRRSRAVARDVLGRLVACLARLNTLVGAIQTQPSITREAVEAIRRWGVPADQTIPPASLASTLGRRLRVASAALAEAGEASHVEGDAPLPAPADWNLDAIPGARVDRISSRLPLPELSRLLTNLVAPEGAFAVSAPLAISDSPMLSSLSAGAAAEPLNDWLSTTAAVRPALSAAEAALLEAVLSGGELAPTLLSNRPHDPWQLEAAPPSPSSPDGRDEPALNRAPMICCLSHAAAVESRMAFTLVDRFAEAVPEAKRPPAVVFGFDAPGARPPQALLVGVPPASAASWTPTGRALLELVLEARALARVRAVLPTDEKITGLASFLPTALVPQFGPVGIQLQSEEGDA